MKANELKKGDVIRAPWCHDGDDANLTGVVQGRKRGLVVVRWNADGDVTAEGDESMLRPDSDVEVAK